MILEGLDKPRICEQRACGGESSSLAGPGWTWLLSLKIIAVQFTCTVNVQNKLTPSLNTMCHALHPTLTSRGRT